jgi:ABC-type phosphate transport system substrate-binding protein
LFRRKIALLVATAAIVGSTTLVAGPAHAGDDGVQRILALAGSDTTSPVSERLAYAYNVSFFNPDRDRVVNVPPLTSASTDLEAAEAGNPLKAWLRLSRLSWASGEVVPADGDCSFERVYGGQGAFDNNNDGDVEDAGDTKYQEVHIDVDGDGVAGEADVPGERVQVGVIPPNGSSAGRSWALDFAGMNPLGCQDLARSSSAPSVAQQPLFDTWGFALDAIDWTYFPGNPHGVTGLNQGQLNKMYTCASANFDANSDGDFLDVGDTAAGEPTYRYWGDLNGNPADTTPIKAYRVQKGSGTGEDVAKTLIGLNANTDIGLNCTNGDAGYPVVQEHDCSGVSDVDKPDAVCFYGYSRWRIQARQLEADKRNGAKFGAFVISGAGTPISPTASSIKEGSGRFDGSRIVYTLITKQTTSGAQPLLPGFRDALDFAGVRPTTGIDVNNDGDVVDATDVPASGSAVPGFVCSAGAAQKIIRTFGMVPFKLGTTDSGNANYGQSYCRHNKYSL